jgi:rhodanese-related sulfurtransferase
MQSVNPKEAKALMDQGWTYLDVRTEGEFAGGHPAGAVNVSLMLAGAGGMAPNPAFIEQVEKRFAKTQKLIVGCQAGGRSQRAAAILEKGGFSQIADQRCGFGGNGTEPGWAAEGLPVER